MCVCVCMCVCVRYVAMKCFRMLLHILLSSGVLKKTLNICSIPLPRKGPLAIHDAIYLFSFDQFVLLTKQQHVYLTMFS